MFVIIQVDSPLKGNHDRVMNRFRIVSGAGQSNRGRETIADTRANGPSTEARRRVNHGYIRHGHRRFRHRCHHGQLSFLRGAIFTRFL